MSILKKFLKKINKESKYDYSRIRINGTFNKSIFEIDKFQIIVAQYHQSSDNDSKIIGYEYVLEFGKNIYLYLSRTPVNPSMGKDWNSDENSWYSLTIIFQQENFEFVKILINKLNKSKNYGY